MDKQELRNFVEIISNSKMPYKDKEYVYGSTAEYLFAIRAAQDKNTKNRNDLETEQIKRFPNPIRVRRLKRDIVSNNWQAFFAMRRINRNTQFFELDKVFDIQEKYTNSSDMHADVESEMKNYWNDIEHDIFENKHINVTREDRETKKGDRKYIDLMIPRHGDVRELVRERPDRSYRQKEEPEKKPREETCKTTGPIIDSRVGNLEAHMHDLKRKEEQQKARTSAEAMAQDLDWYLSRPKSVKEDPEVALSVLKNDPETVSYIPKTVIMYASFRERVRKEAPESYKEVTKRYNKIVAQGHDGPGDGR